MRKLTSSMKKITALVVALSLVLMLVPQTADAASYKKTLTKTTKLKDQHPLNFEVNAKASGSVKVSIKILAMTGNGGTLNFVNEDGSQGKGSGQEDIRKNQTFTMTSKVKKGKNTFKIYNYYRGTVKIKITVKSSKANVKFGKIYDPEKEIAKGNGDMLGDSIGR